MSTIAAISSPPGAALRGIIRVSGPRAIACADTVFAADDGAWLGEQPSRTWVPGRVSLTAVQNEAGGHAAQFPAAAMVFRAPASYTGEDVVELHLPGQSAVLAAVVQGILAAGAQPAEPGEFTRRAVFSGKLDLTAAEGVAAVIAAENDSELRAGQQLLDGHLARGARAASDALADATALVEAGIDFVDEGVGFIPADALRERVAGVQQQVREWLSGGAAARGHRATPRAALLGLPNAGKSTLLNSLSGVSRALCSPLAGTTRDVLRVPLRAKSDTSDVDLLDMAGIDAAGDDDISRQMREHALAACRGADLVLLVIDAPRARDAAAMKSQFDAWLGDAMATRRVVLTKADLLAAAEADERLAELARVFSAPAHAVCAATGAGVATLAEVIREAVHAEHRPTAAASELALTERHVAALREADESLSAVLSRLAIQPAGDVLCDPELLAQDLRAALDAIGRIIGRCDSDDLLGLIFSKFCIGK